MALGWIIEITGQRWAVFRGGGGLQVVYRQLQLYQRKFVGSAERLCPTHVWKRAALVCQWPECVEGNTLTAALITVRGIRFCWCLCGLLGSVFKMLYLHCTVLDKIQGKQHLQCSSCISMQDSIADELNLH